MKKASLTLETIVRAIVVLLVVSLTYFMLDDHIRGPAYELLELDKYTLHDVEIEDRFAGAVDANREAINSVNALLYGINSLAVIESGIGYSIAQGTTKTFGDSKVQRTFHDRRTITLKGNREQVLWTLSDALIDCWGVFRDKAYENTRCYLVKVHEEVDYNVLNEFEEYFQNVECRRLCDDTHNYEACVNRCDDAKTDLLGDSWNPFDVKNFEYGITPGEVFDNGGEFRICGSGDAIDEIHFSVNENYCEAPIQDTALGFVVNDFTLPQEIQKSDSPYIYGIEEWLNAYGDPKYVLFYEQFPREEAEYWSAEGYKVAWSAIIATEIGISVVSGLTFGLGKPIAAVLKKIPVAGRLFGIGEKAIGFTGKAARITVDSIQGVGGAVIGAIGGGVFAPVRSAVRWATNRLMRQSAIQDIAQESSEQILARTVARELGEDVAQELEEGTITLFQRKATEVLSNLGEESFDDAGRLTAQGAQDFETKLYEALNLNLLQEERPLLGGLGSITRDKYQDIVRRYATEMGTGLTQTSARSIIPANILRAYHAADRTRAMLREIFLGDMTDARRREVIMEALDNFEAPFRAMKPRDLRIFMANQQKATKILNDLIEGRIGDESQKAAAKELRDSMDKVLDKVVFERTDLETNFLTGVQMQKMYSGTAQSVTQGLQKPRHLIALMAGWYALKLESMEGKYHSVGTNAIGLKTPYLATVTYDEEYTQELSGLTEYESFLDNYGKGQNFGLLPEVEKYYISLIRDKEAYWFDQPPSRFHLVSPCYADVFMTVSTCDCKGAVDEGIYETGQTYSIGGEAMRVPHFDGNNPSLYTLDQAGRPVKVCRDAEWLRWDSSYPTQCIKIDPVLDEMASGAHNYCYHGWDPGAEALGWGIFGAQVGVTAGCAYITAGVGSALCFGVGSAIAGIVGEGLKGEIGISRKWPNN